jgi:hypothetical protein
MSFSKWILRKGAVGGTVRWVIKNYLGLYTLDPDQSLLEIIQKLIIARCSVLNDPSEEQMLMELSNNMKGLRGLVMSLLCTEAHYMENTDEGKKIILEVVNEELLKSGLGNEILFGE